MSYLDKMCVPILLHISGNVCLTLTKCVCPFCYISQVMYVLPWQNVCAHFVTYLRLCMSYLDKMCVPILLHISGNVCLTLTKCVCPFCYISHVTWKLPCDTKSVHFLCKLSVIFLLYLDVNCFAICRLITFFSITGQWLITLHFSKALHSENT